MHSFLTHPVFFYKLPCRLKTRGAAGFLPLTDAVSASFLEGRELHDRPVRAVFRWSDGFSFQLQTLSRHRNDGKDAYATHSWKNPPRSTYS